MPNFLFDTKIYYFIGVFWLVAQLSLYFFAACKPHFCDSLKPPTHIFRDIRQGLFARAYSKQLTASRFQKSLLVEFFTKADSTRLERGEAHDKQTNRKEGSSLARGFFRSVFKIQEHFKSAIHGLFINQVIPASSMFPNYRRPPYIINRCNQV